MTDVTIRTLDASIKSIPQDIVAALRGKLRGSVALPGEDGYDAVRSIWNAMVDRRPGLVVRCLGAADVINAVKLAHDESCSSRCAGVATTLPATRSVTVV
jgi:hypothetical protein